MSAPPLYSVEALGTRAYLHVQASQDAKRKVAAPFVMVDQSRNVVAYYTLSAYAIRASELPPAMARTLPKYPLLPVTLLGPLGREPGASRSEVGPALIVGRFYLHHEFMPLVEHPRKLFIAMGTIQKALS